MSKTHWKRLINPDYIGAYSLDEGRDLTVQITQVRRDIVVGTGGKKEECTIAYLNGNKPLILNNTNSKTIAKLYGPYIEDWAGKKITLFATTTKLAGDTVECLRVRPLMPKTDTEEAAAQKEYDRLYYIMEDAAKGGRAKFEGQWRALTGKERAAFGSNNLTQFAEVVKAADSETQAAG